jgi:hypothetical protein
MGCYFIEGKKIKFQPQTCLSRFPVAPLPMGTGINVLTDAALSGLIKEKAKDSAILKFWVF